MPTEETIGAVLLKSGYEVLGKVIASKGELLYTKAELDKGQIPEGTAVEDLTAPCEYAGDGMISSIENTGPGEATVSVQASSAGLAEGFFITGVMLYVRDPEDIENPDAINIAYTYLPLQEHPEWLAPDNNPINKMVNFSIANIISAAENVTAIINPDSFVRKEDLDKYALKEHTHETTDVDGLDDRLDNLDQAVSEAKEAGVKIGSVILSAAAWQQDPVSQLYTQPVTIPGLTASSKVDFDADVTIMAELPAAIQPVNDNGTLTAVTLSPPETDIQVQVTVVNTKAVTIQTAPTIVTQLVNPLPVENEAYTFTFGAVGNVPFTWQLTGGSLPDGLSLSSTGVLSGTPTAQTGLMSFTVKVSNEYGEDTQTFSISVAGPSGIAVPDLPNGTLVQIQKDGSPVLFYKAVSDYESDLNGAGRQLMVRKDCYNQRQWNSSNVNAYATSTIDSSLNGEYKALFPQAVQEMMGATKFYYTPGNGNNAVSTLERAVFLLSATELGRSQSWFNVEGSILPIASALQIAQLNGIAVSQWTRSPDTYGTDVSIRFDENGMAYDGHCSNSYGCRPCFTLPATAMVNPTPNPDGSYTLIE